MITLRIPLGIILGASDHCTLQLINLLFSPDRRELERLLGMKTECPQKANDFSQIAYPWVKFVDLVDPTHHELLGALGHILDPPGTL